MFILSIRISFLLGFKKAYFLCILANHLMLILFAYHPLYYPLCELIPTEYLLVRILHVVLLLMNYLISLLMLFRVIPFLHLHHFCLALTHTLSICLLHILIPNMVNSYPLSFPLFLNICLISHLFASLSEVRINYQIKNT